MTDDTSAAALRDSLPAALPFDACDLSGELIKSRFRWARLHGHPFYLWPDVPITAWREALGEIERLTALVLKAGDGGPPIELATQAPARAFGVAAFTSGMGPLLGYWIETGRLRTNPQLTSLLRLHLEHGRLRTARLQGALVQALDVLDGAGLAVGVVKGMHTAHVYFPEPATRPLADIDLIVSLDDLPAAERALAAAGYERETRSLNTSPAKCDWFPPGAPRALCSLELTHADNPFTIDLHGSLDRNFLGVRTLSLGSIDHSRLRPWPQLHPEARILAQPLLLAYLAAHASQELRRLSLVRIVELVSVIRMDRAQGRLDWGALETLLEDIGGLRFVYPALALAEQLCPGVVDAKLLSEMTQAATPRMRRVLSNSGLSGIQQLERFSVAEALMWASGPKEYLRLAFNAVWPRGTGSWKRRRIWADRLSRLLRSGFSGER